MTTPPRKASQINPATVPLPETLINRQEQAIFQISIVTSILLGLLAISFLVSALQQPLIAIRLLAIYYFIFYLHNCDDPFRLDSNSLARKKYHSQELNVLVLVVQIALALFSAMVNGTGIVIAFIALIYTILVVSAVLTSGHSDIAIIIGIIGAIVISILGTYPPVTQLNFPAAQIFVPAILVFLIIAFIVLLSMKFVTATLPIKLITGTLAITLIPMAFLAFIENSFTQNSLRNADNQSLDLAASQSAGAVDDFISTNLYSINVDASFPIFANYLVLPETQKD